jgi:esterase/lipase superfamily enzyme
MHFLLACRNWLTIMQIHALDFEREKARGASNMIGKVKIDSKVNVVENACVVARARHLMTNGKFAEGYDLIKDMQGGDFLTALRMLVDHEALVKRLSDIRERHKTRGSESIAALLARAAEGGDEEAMSLLAAGALERQV